MEGKEEELPSSELRGFDSTHSRIMLGCNDTTTRGRRQLFERNVVSLWFSLVANCTSSLHCQVIITLDIIDVTWCFSFFLLRQLCLHTVATKSMDTLFYLLHVRVIDCLAYFATIVSRSRRSTLNSGFWSWLLVLSFVFIVEWTFFMSLSKVGIGVHWLSSLTTILLHRLLYDAVQISGFNRRGFI